MAIIYYPNGSQVIERNSIAGNQVVEVLDVLPDSIFYFDTTGSIKQQITVESASYSATASIALNVPAFASTSWTSQSLSASWASKSLNSDTSSLALTLQKGANIHLSNSYIYSNTSASAPSLTEGQLWWDKVNHTYAIDELDARLQIGQENYIRAIAGELIPKGAPVYIEGTDIDPDAPASPTTKIPVIWLALADGSNTTSDVIGIATEEILSSNRGFITTQGVVDNTDTSLFADGDTLYLSYTNSGSLINSIPPEPYEKIKIGTVLFSDNTLGKILVQLSTLPNISQHNSLLSIQGGSGSGEYYHLTSASFVKVSAGNSDTASYLKPGATFYVVSGSNGVPPAYIEPYDYSPESAIYSPPYKAGRIFFDNRYNDWAWYAATGSGATSWRSHLGKEVSFGVHNPYAVTLPRLSVVYIGTSSVAGQYQPDVYLAQADGTGTKASILGVIRNDIPSGSNGFCMTNGVMHRTNMGTYNVGDRLWLSPTVPGGLTTTQPGQPNEQVLIGYCSEAGTLGSFICRQSTFPPPPQAFAGITSDVIITNNNNDTVTVSTGSVNLYPDSAGAGIITPYGLSSRTFTLTTGSTNYIIVEHSGSSITTAWYDITTDSTYANGINIVRVASLDTNYKGPGNWEIHEADVGIIGLALANRINNKDILLYGYQRASGLTLYVTGSTGNFGVTEGTVFYGPNQHIFGAFLSTNTASCDTYHYVSSASVWTFTTSSNYDNAHYNDPALGLVPLGPNSCSAAFVYRLATENVTDVIIIRANQQFADIIDTVNNVQPPVNLPQIVGTMTLLVGMIAYKSGSYIDSNVQSSFSTLFAPATITQHNSLLSIQGGTGGEYYHLSADDNTGTGTGVMVRANGPTIINANISGSLFGTVSTASYVIVAQTASFVEVAQTVVSVSSASFITTAQTASYVMIAQNVVNVSSASFITTAQTASYVMIAQNVVNVSSASFITTAQTASYVSASNVSGVVASASWSPNQGATTLTTASTYQITASWSRNAISASWAPFTQTYQVSGSWASASISASWAPFTQTYQVSGSWASASISASWAPVPISSSWASASINALTASYMNGVVTATISGSNFTTTNASAVKVTPLSFIMQAGESWICNGYFTAQASNARGMNVAISSSDGTFGDVEGWYMSVGNNITTLVRQRITAVNTKLATAVHTQANTAGPDTLQLCLINPSAATTVSFAVSSTNGSDTMTVFAGSYIHARKVN